MISILLQPESRTSLPGRPKEYDGKPVFLTGEDVIKIADAHSATPGQVALSWGVQRGTVVIPKSENPERIKQNITVYLPSTT